MPKKPLTRMPVSERAKQFMPFSALKGYEEALAQKRHITVDRIELTDDMAEELDIAIRQIKAGTIITVIYYANDEYIKLQGMVAKLSLEERRLQIVDTIINFDDILKLEL